jgi:thermolysin
MLAGRRHERLEQLHRGVPVWGGEIARQSDDAGTLTVFGTIYEGIEIETRPTLGEPAGRRAVVAAGGGGGLFPDEVELVVLPRGEGDDLAYSLAWRGRVLKMPGVRMIFVDAHTGETLLDYSDFQTQSAVGTGTGVLGDAKKMSVSSVTGSFLAQDALRPPAIHTLDMRGNPLRIDAIFARFPSAIATTDYAADTDNTWTDGGAVDAHAYAGYTYDYFFKRHGRRGLDNANITMRSFVNPVRREDLTTNLSIYGNDILDYYINAGYYGVGVMVYGVGLPTGFTSGGQRWNNFAGSLDIVAHELTHGVTGYSSRLVYQNESGALNEAFSDIMGTAVEFYFETPGTGPRQAEYLLAEDIATAAAFPLNGIRSMQNPSLFGDPDHYSVRFTGTADNGGVHINSGIANHAFYLAIEGGTHRLGGRVTGVGAANREQIERVFYRAFTSFLVPSSNFAAARVATIQAARELYSSNPAVEAAITQAWNAVGVN